MTNVTEQVRVRRRLQRTTFSHVVIWLAVILTAAGVLATLLIAFFTSLKTPEETMTSAFQILPKTWRFQNYAEMIAGDIWGRYFLNSTYITVMVVILSILFSSLAGYSFARLRFRGRQPLFFLFLCGLMIPCQAYIIPQYIILRSMPLVGGNDLFGQGGFGLLNSYWSLIVPFTAAPLGIFLMRQFYMTFPRSLDEAATIDGCSSFGIYWHIFLPMSKPVFATFAILKFTGTWNDYFYPLIMINEKQMYTVQIGLQQFKGEFLIEWQYLMAATVLSILPILLVFLFAQKYFTQGIVTSGLK